MKRNLKMLSVALVLAGLVFSSCKKDKVEGNDEEVITTMQLTFVPSGGGSTLVYDYDDPDGPGGTAPTIDEIVLSPLKTYSVTLTLLNKTVTPAEDITTEISDEADAHRFYFDASATSNLLRLLQLTAPAQELLLAGDLDMGHARALLPLPAADQSRLAQEAASRRWSVRDTERAVARRLSAPVDQRPERQDRDLLRLQEEIADRLGAAVAIRSSRRGAGTIQIRFGSLDELEGILARLQR